jgi:hypothetical protein
MTRSVPAIEWVSVCYVSVTAYLKTANKGVAVGKFKGKRLAAKDHGEVCR